MSADAAQPSGWPRPSFSGFCPSSTVSQTSSRPLPTGWLIFWAIVLCATLAGFMALGIWQIQRMHWKHDLIARVGSFLNAPPVSAPGPDTWGSMQADQDEYRRVILQGTWLDHEILVQANTQLGPGFWVMTPLQRNDGSIVFINRGFVDAAHRDPALRGENQANGPAQVEGLLRLSQPDGAFLRTNAPAEQRWYSRDTAAMAHTLGLSPVAPYFVDQSDPMAGPVRVNADDLPASALAPPQHWPVPGLTIVHFRDHHLSYALTWFGLAAMTAAALVYGAHLERRRRAGRRS